MFASTALLKSLENEGVKDIFGYPGAAINPFFAVLAGSSINFTLVRAEASAGFAANGYARVSGRVGVRGTNTVGGRSTNTVGVCAATSGAGALGLLPAIACAYADSIPIVAITGQVKTAEVGSDAFQEADIIGAAEPFVKYSYLVKNPNDIPRIVREAFYLAAAGRQGPVLIDIPVDVQEAECDFYYPESVNLRSYNPTREGNVFQIKKAADAIIASKRPLIIAGGGVHSSNAVSLLREFAASMNIPVVSTMMGLGSISGKSTLNLGMIGIHGNSRANNALFEADTLIFIGARAGERSIPTPEKLSGKEIIHVDIDPAEIGKNIIPTIPIVSDCTDFFVKLSARLPERLFETPWATAQEKTSQETLYETSHETPQETPLERYFNVLSEFIAPDTIIVADVGNNQIAASKIRLTDGRFLTSGGMGSMGYALGALIGVLTANREQNSICITGDGGFQMSLAELATIKTYSLPAKIIIVNDSSLGMVKDTAVNMGITSIAGGFATDLSLGNPDFTALAKSYGIKAETVKDFNTDSLKRLLESKSAYLLNVVI
ncbi:MAG: thiamine pyrophosphate-binding protein [Ruminococcus sp.]|jgi:acetolactate synthase-1/2/3 large subunit|nr:thiamine pyrophosphate-binding protein [Ruminococcus sp.]